MSVHHFIVRNRLSTKSRQWKKNSPVVNIVDYVERTENKNPGRRKARNYVNWRRFWSGVSFVLSWMRSTRVLLRISRFRRSMTLLVWISSQYLDGKSIYVICPNGRMYTAIGTTHRKSKSGFTSEVTLYGCTECRNCPLKAEWMKSKNGRTIRRSKVPKKTVRAIQRTKHFWTGYPAPRQSFNPVRRHIGRTQRGLGIQEISAQRQKERLYRNPDLCVCVQYPELYAKEGNQRRSVILHSMKEAS